MIIDNAIYFDGRRNASPVSIADTFDACQTLDGMAWIDLAQPEQAELDLLADEFSLHPLSIQDAVRAHQRPKAERYGSSLFVVLKAARYVDSEQLIELDELHLFVGERFIVTIRHGVAPDLATVRGRLESDPDLLRKGPYAVLYAIADLVVDDYTEATARLGDDIDEIETRIFQTAENVTRRTYDLSREVIEFQRVVDPVPALVAAILATGDHEHRDKELIRSFRDVEDHAIRVNGQVGAYRDLLQNIVSVNLSIVGQRQNDEVRALTEASLRQNDELRVLSETALRQSEEVKKISAWAAILFAPTLIGTVYGMNFDNMPELNWRFGYPIAVALMVLTAVILFLIFRTRGWLTSTSLPPVPPPSQRG